MSPLGSRCEITSAILIVPLRLLIAVQAIWMKMLSCANGLVDQEVSKKGKDEDHNPGEELGMSRVGGPLDGRGQEFGQNQHAEYPLPGQEDEHHDEKGIEAAHTLHHGMKKKDGNGRNPQMVVSPVQKLHQPLAVFADSFCSNQGLTAARRMLWGEEYLEQGAAVKAN